MKDKIDYRINNGYAEFVVIERGDSRDKDRTRVIQGVGFEGTLAKLLIYHEDCIDEDERRIACIGDDRDKGRITQWYLGDTDYLLDDQRRIVRAVVNMHNFIVKRILL